MSVDHYENFPVASVLCPPALRPAIRAIYHFARTADDLADEGPADAAQRLQDLREYRMALRAVFRAQPLSPRWPGIFAPLAVALERHDLPLAPLEALLDAFEQDVQNPRYGTRDELIGYCRLSANPVGRLLLHLYGIHDADSLRQSDAICSALQLVNFWQDLSVDLARSRCYVPAADARRHGLELDALTSGGDSRDSRRLVCDLVQWTRSLMESGRPLALRLPGRVGWELRLVVQGGLRILEKIERMDCVSLSFRPTLGAIDLPLLLWRALTMRWSTR